MKLLKRLFGPNQNVIWKQLSDEIGADFTKGSFFRGVSKVEARVKNWAVTLDTFAVSTGKSYVVYTRMRAPFINNDGFRFTIYRKGVFSSVGKLLGMQDVEVGGPKFGSLEPLFGSPSYVDPQVIESGDPEFDKEFIIKGNDEQKVMALFKRLKVRDLIRSQPAIQLQVKDSDRWPSASKNEGVDVLYFQEAGVIKDPGRLKGLFKLYEEVLNALHSLGTASEKQVPEKGRRK
jgi:hypothetical protein